MRHILRGSEQNRRLMGIRPAQCFNSSTTVLFLFFPLSLTDVDMFRIEYIEFFDPLNGAKCNRPLMTPLNIHQEM
jgi:hypothetical protein